MVRFGIRVSRRFEKELSRIDRAGRADIVDRVLAALSLLEEDPATPRPGLDVKKLAAAPRGRLFRLRIGEYRVLYEIDFDSNLVFVTTIFHRSRGYRF